MEVAGMEELGADAFIYGRIAVRDEPRSAVVRAHGCHPAAKGDAFRVAIDPNTAHVFDTASGTRLSRSSH